jgi:hypothetical protein
LVAGGTIWVGVALGISGVCVAAGVLVIAWAGKAVAVNTRGGNVAVGAIGEKIAVKVRSGPGENGVGAVAPGKLHAWSNTRNRTPKTRRWDRFEFISLCLQKKISFYRLLS